MLFRGSPVPRGTGVVLYPIPPRSGKNELKKKPDAVWYAPVRS